jgi:hypothetical protein
MLLSSFVEIVSYFVFRERMAERLMCGDFFDRENDDEFFDLPSGNEKLLLRLIADPYAGTIATCRPFRVTEKKPQEIRISPSTAPIPPLLFSLDDYRESSCKGSPLNGGKRT